MKDWRTAVYNALIGDSELLTLLEYVDGREDKKIYVDRPDNVDIDAKIPCLIVRIEGISPAVSGDEDVLASECEVRVYAFTRDSIKDIFDRVISVFRTNFVSHISTISFTKLDDGIEYGEGVFILK